MDNKVVKVPEWWSEEDIRILTQMMNGGSLLDIIQCAEECRKSTWENREFCVYKLVRAAIKAAEGV